MSKKISSAYTFVCMKIFQLIFTAFCSKIAVCGFCLSLLAWQSSAQIVNIEKERIRNHDSVGMMGKVSMTFSIIQNKTRLINAEFNPHLQYKNKKHLLLLIGQGVYAALDKKTVTNGAYGHLRYNYVLRPQIKAECFTQLQYNRIWNMPLRFLLGAGPRFKLFDVKQNRIYAAPLYLYEMQVVASGKTTQINHRLSAYLSWNIAAGSTLFFAGTVYYQPLLRDFSNYRVSGQGELNIAISKHLSFENKLTCIFDQTRTVDIPAESFQYSAGFGFKF